MQSRRFPHMPNIKRVLMVAALMALLAPLLIQSLDTVWAQETSPVQLTIEIGEPSLLAKGAAVAVPITFTCSGLVDIQFGEVRVELDQRGRAQTVNRGWGYADPSALPCDGTAQTLTVNVSGNAAYKHGAAFARAFIFACGPTVIGGEYTNFACGDASTSAEVRVR